MEEVDGALQFLDAREHRAALVEVDPEDAQNGPDQDLDGAEDGAEHRHHRRHHAGEEQRRAVGEVDRDGLRQHLGEDQHAAPSSPRSRRCTPRSPEQRQTSRLVISAGGADVGDIVAEQHGADQPRAVCRAGAVTDGDTRAGRRFSPRRCTRARLTSPSAPSRPLEKQAEISDTGDHDPRGRARIPPAGRAASAAQRRASAQVLCRFPPSRNAIEHRP